MERHYGIEFERVQWRGRIEGEQRNGPESIAELPFLPKGPEKGVFGWCSQLEPGKKAGRKMKGVH